MVQPRDEHHEAVCPLCNTMVAPYAPERMPLGKEILHRHCWEQCSAWKQAQLVQATGAPPAAGLT